MEAMRTACEGARAHILRGPHKQVGRFEFEYVDDTLELNKDCRAGVPKKHDC